MHEPEIVRLFGKYAPPPALMRWLLAFLVGVVLVCTLVGLQGCTSDTPYKEGMYVYTAATAR